MASVNKWIGIGNLGKDVEMRYTASGDAIANFSIACTENWKDKNSGEKKEQTEWVRCTVFGKLAEICGTWLKKGSQVYIEGSLRTRKWTDKENVERYTTEIKVDEMKMLGAKPAGQSNQNSENYAAGNDGYAPAPQRSAQGAPPPKRNFDDLGDDILFQQHAGRGALGHVI